MREASDERVGPAWERQARPILQLAVLLALPYTPQAVAQEPPPQGPCALYADTNSTATCSTTLVGQPPELLRVRLGYPKAALARRTCGVRSHGNALPRGGAGRRSQVVVRG